MIDRIKMKPQVSFSGMNALQDPLNPRNSYQAVLNDNKAVLDSERQKIQALQNSSQKGDLLDLKV